MTKKKKEKTYASSRSKPSFRTPVTFRIVSKLFVASANILCNVTSAALANTTFLFHYTHYHFPTRRQEEDGPRKTAHTPCGEAAGDVALDEGPDLTPPSAPVPPLALRWPPLSPRAPQRTRPSPAAETVYPSPSPTPKHRIHTITTGFTSPPLWQLQNKPPRWLRQRPTSILGHHTHDLADRMHNIPPRICGFPLVCFRDGWTTGWTHLRRGRFVGLR